MRVLITGASGQLGNELQRTAPAYADTAPLTRQQLDITSKDALHHAISEYNPDVVINTAAYVKVDAAEDESDAAFRVNSTAVRDMADICENAGIILLHVSTDYVFDGKKSPLAYFENDRPSPLCTYGMSKLAGELYAANLCSKHYIVRTSGLYASRGSAGKGGNFVLSIINKAKNREPIRVVDDIITSPTFARDCAGAIWKILGSEMPFGIYHAANSGYCSWHEFAQHILNSAGFNTDVERIKHTDYPAKAHRPLWSVLGTTTKIQLRHWKEAVEEYIISEGAAK